VLRGSVQIVLSRSERPEHRPAASLADSIAHLALETQRFLDARLPRDKVVLVEINPCQRVQRATPLLLRVRNPAKELKRRGQLFASEDQVAFF
jgi:hypothetical protein